MGFKQPTPIQKACIPVGLLGKDICACAATGTGDRVGGAGGQNTLGFLKIYFILNMSVLLACMHMYFVCRHVEARRRCCMPCNWSSRL